MGSHRKPSFEVREDLPFHRRQWIVQRVGWGVGLLVLVLGLLGFFGDGPLSTRHTSAQALQVEYERFLRRDDSSPLRIDVHPTHGDEVSLAFSRDYLQAFRIDSILPNPERTYASGHDVVLTFRVTTPGVPTRITILQTPLQLGTLRAALRIPGNPVGSEVSFEQFVYP